VVEAGEPVFIGFFGMNVKNTRSQSSHGNTACRIPWFCISGSQK
jgi:hypothetical protein